jgi:hypothetical protein
MRRPHFALDERLSILRDADHFRHWTSLDDKRFCVLCEKSFTGRQVEITQGPRGRVQLHCPTENCHAGPSRWVYPGNPLVSDVVYEDWWRALGDAEEEQSIKPTIYRQQRYA